MVADSLRIPLVLLLSLSAGAAGAQSHPQTNSMTLGVARSVVQTVNVADGARTGTVKVLVTLGQYVSTFAPTTLVRLKPDVK